MYYGLHLPVEIKRTVDIGFCCSGKMVSTVCIYAHQIIFGI